jgi:hypothetical protein
LVMGHAFLLDYLLLSILFPLLIVSSSLFKACRWRQNMSHLSPWGSAQSLT